jgi:MFS transporter, FHS family, Na+ dependent glucose transporter 1
VYKVINQGTIELVKTPKFITDFSHQSSTKATMKISSRQTIGYFAAYFMLGAIMASLGPTLPGLIENAGVSKATIGLVFSARSFGYLNGALLSGILYDRFKGHLILGVFAVFSALALWWVPTVTIFILLAALMFVIGITQGGTDVGCNTQLAAVHKAKVGPLINAMFFVAGLGSFFIPLLLGKLPLTWGYRLLALALLPVAVWLFTTNSPQIGSATHESQVTLPTRPVIIILFMLLAFIYTGTEVSYGGWIFTYFNAGNLGSENTAYQINSFFYLAITFGRLLSIPLAARLKSQRMLWGYLGGAAFSAALMAFLPAQPWSIWLGTAGLGLSIAAIFPTTFTYVKSRTNLSGKQTGLVWASGSFGAMVLPWLIGQGIEFQSPTSMMVILLICWILALGLFLLMNHTGIETRSH